ncbi:type II toxin-antitoxin system PemK/MazF family toxin [Kitasatospora sp. NPDC056181]|uniref:type II toxin-antitoxin system PemK/MazF family toxin n=1 Tax=Kitasatospora sp. NPDC056181 TaxID=3345737 RepID=UPI0035DE80F0
MTGIWVVLAVAGVAVLALAVLRRSRKAPAAPRARPRPAKGRPGPAPQEIWWAQVPFEDGPGVKDRPCLVLRVNGRTATVAKITSKHHADRPGVLPLPPGSVGDRQGRTSWLETDELREVPLADFRRRAGVVDRQIWARAQRAVSAGQ